MHAWNALNEAKKKLAKIAAQQEEDNQCCLEAVQKVENFKKKLNDTLSKISILETKLTTTKTDVTELQAAKQKMLEEKKSLEEQLVEKNKRAG